LDELREGATDDAVWCESLLLFLCAIYSVINASLHLKTKNFIPPHLKIRKFTPPHLKIRSFTPPHLKIRNFTPLT
jgi:hypothetical protein